MVGAHKESNMYGSGSVFQSLVMRTNLEVGKENGVEFHSETGSRSQGIRTYKRRRNANVSENGKRPQDSVTQLSEKSTKHMFDRAQLYQNGSYDPRVLSNGCSLKQPRNIILEQISQSMDSDGGLKKCIQNALVFDRGGVSRTIVKESVHSSLDFIKCSSRTRSSHFMEKAAEGNLGIPTNGSLDESKHCTFTELCQRTFSDIILTEKFEQLCCLLHENFKGLNADKVFNLIHINARMKENAYESSPLLFKSDIREIWKNLEKVGSDITALAKCLADKSVTSFHEQVGNSSLSIPHDGKYEFPTQESETHTKAEQTDEQAPDEAHTCRRCRQKADGKNALVCDSCERMYHVSCTEPAVKEIPTRSWYCAHCTSKELDSSHENCVACERLNMSDPRSSFEKYDFSHDETTTEELNESLNEFFPDEEDIKNTQCKVCRSEVRDDEDEYRICGHLFCGQKYYHAKCLTGQQLTCYGQCWYCPSCLCTACLTDRDDDKIVLCDGCDHAYHIYCTDPPCLVIPEGKWFCQECAIGIERIRKARRTYVPNVSRKSKGEEGSDKSGGVDMLLNAAKT